MTRPPRSAITRRKRSSFIKKAETVDCIAMKREADLRIYEETKGRDHESAYWRAQEEKFAARRQHVPGGQPPHTVPDSEQG